MNNIAIRADRLSKSYKLYDAPRHRLLDIMGFNRSARSGIKLHHALSDISFDIQKGEKVAIIGRNGAGKSTLLKLITKVITPTSGTLDVHGETRALLSLGSGFHPEFTGRQNASAYLSSLGFSGADLAGMVEDAISFAELDDYADQPIKTYSTGMAMRLMFASATMMKPDLLVIDEVLGVGDAYFQQKSFQHISAICASHQTTLLLVTHDIYNAAQLCDRMIWIDRGRMLIDADPATVMRAYQDSIREQEERRLRTKALVRAGYDETTTRLLLDIQSVGNQAPPAPLHVSRISLLVRGVQIASVPLGADADEPGASARIVAEGSNWGEPGQFQGRLSRALNDHGSPFHKATVAFDLPLRDEDRPHLSARLEFWCDAPARFHIRLHGASFECDLGILPLKPGAWNDVTSEEPAAAAHGITRVEVALPIKDQAADEAQPAQGAKLPVSVMSEPAAIPGDAQTTAAAPLASVSTDPQIAPSQEVLHDPSPEEAAMDQPATQAIRSISPSLNVSGIYGTGDVALTELRVSDNAGRERYVFEAGEAVTFALHYTIRRKSLREKLHIVFAFKRDGVADVMRLLSSDILFDGSVKQSGILEASFEQLPLGIGRYEITVLAACAGYYDTVQTVFFSMNPDVYAVRMTMAEIIVGGTSQIYGGTGAVVATRWKLV